MSTSHSLVLGLFDTEQAAASAARALRELGLPRERVSIVARTLAVEGALADVSGGSPGSEIEESRTAARAGELGAYVIAAVAMVLPGIGPIVAAGPLASELGDAAGHLAGGVARALEHAGLERARAGQWETRVAAGAVLVGAHVREDGIARILDSISRHGASDHATVSWPGELV